MTRTDHTARSRTDAQDTIAAPATAPGEAAVAIVRLSGPDAARIAERVTGGALQPRAAMLRTFRDPEGAPIDQGLVLYFPAPQSYTGEDVVELQGHGGPVLVDWLLQTLYRHGARAAQPGEFTLRAFLNDKLDLAQAEAVADLIGSGSRAAARAALRSLDGRFSSQVDALYGALTRVRVHVEAWLDFPDEEIEREAADELERQLDDVLAQVETLLARAAEGRVLRDGLTVVIAGPPNAGKSSLMNRLAGYEAAIVTEIAGTTRDALREQLSLDGLPIHLIDTAGLRDSADPIEAEGVRRAQRELERADRVLWMMDAGEGAERAAAAARASLGDDARVTLLLNKIDLDGGGATIFDGPPPAIRLSALTGEGFDLLVQHLKAIAGWRHDTGGTFSARRRHLDALERTAHHLRAARGQLRGALELGAEDLRHAEAALAELTGRRTSDDLLGEIFSTFCIGK